MNIELVDLSQVIFLSSSFLVIFFSGKFPYSRGHNMQHSHANIALNRQLLSQDVFACTSNNFNPLFLVSDSPGSHCNHSEKFSNINAHICLRAKIST